MKRFAISAAVVMALLLSAGTTMAAGNGSTVESIPTSGAPVTPAACSEVPTGTTITWSTTPGTSIATRYVNQGIRLNLPDGIR